MLLSLPILPLFSHASPPFSPFACGQECGDERPSINHISAFHLSISDRRDDSPPPQNAAEHRESKKQAGQLANSSRSDDRRNWILSRRSTEVNNTTGDVADNTPISPSIWNFKANESESPRSLIIRRSKGKRWLNRRKYDTKHKQKNTKRQRLFNPWIEQVALSSPSLSWCLPRVLISRQAVPLYVCMRTYLLLFYGSRCKDPGH